MDGHRAGAGGTTPGTPGLHLPGTPARTPRTPGTPSSGRLRSSGGPSPVTPGPGAASRTPSGGRTPATPGTPSGRRHPGGGRLSLNSLGSSSGSVDQPGPWTPVSPGRANVMRQTSQSPSGPPGGPYRPYYDFRKPKPNPYIPISPGPNPKNMFNAIYEYEAQGEDELTLRKGDTIEVLSKDYKISGDEGWWTGKCNGKVGVFPCNFVAPFDLDFSDLKREELNNFYPPYIAYNQLKVANLIGIGGFGKVFRGYFEAKEVAIKEVRTIFRPTAHDPTFIHTLL